MLESHPAHAHGVMPEWPVVINLSPAARGLMAASLGDGSNADGLADKCGPDRGYDYWMDREQKLRAGLDSQSSLIIIDADDALLVQTAFSSTTAFADCDLWPRPMLASRSRVLYRLRDQLEHALMRPLQLPPEFS